MNISILILHTLRSQLLFLFKFNRRILLNYKFNSILFQDQPEFRLVLKQLEHFYYNHISFNSYLFIYKQFQEFALGCHQTGA